MLTKPGGYAWCFRDGRIAVLRLLGSLRNVSAGSGRYDYLGQMRSRTHFWIAEWYAKAFASTGHYIPLIESIFHRLEAVRYALFAKPSTKSIEHDMAVISGYRRSLILNSLNEVIKILKIGRNGLKFWLSGGPHWSLFDDCVIDDLARLIRDAPPFSLSSEPLEAIDEALNATRQEFLSVKLALQAESGFPKGKLYRGYERAAPPPATTPQLAAPLDSSSSTVGCSLSELSCLSGDNSWRERFVEFGRLQMPSSGSDSDLDRLCAVIDKFLDTPNSCDGVATLRNAIPNWRSTIVYAKAPDYRNSTQRRLRSLIWLVSELAYYYARRAKILSHANLVQVPAPISITDCDSVFSTNPEGKATAEVLKHWTVVSVMCWLCIDLCRSLAAEHADFEIDSKVRCGSLYGLSLGYLARFSEAHRRLNEVHALMSRGRAGLRGLEFALLQLRRAEVYLCMAELSVHKWTKKGQSSILMTAPFLAHIDDAWASLERAGNVLSGASHSSLWWGRLYSLKLRAYSLYGQLDKTDFGELMDCGRRPLPFRYRVQFDDFVKSLVNKALLATEGDDYRSLRACRYFFRVASLFDRSCVHLGGKFTFGATGGETVASRVIARLDAIDMTRMAPLLRCFAGHVKAEAKSAGFVLKP